MWQLCFSMTREMYCIEYEEYTYRRNALRAVFAFYRLHVSIVSVRTYVTAGRYRTRGYISRSRYIHDCAKSAYGEIYFNGATNREDIEKRVTVFVSHYSRHSEGLLRQQLLYNAQIVSTFMHKGMCFVLGYKSLSK